MSSKLLPTQLTDSDDDWIEGFRHYWYPKLHPYLNELGGYAVGTSNDEQYVGKVAVNEDEFERVLEDLGFVRNPIACFKSAEDGRESEGTWCLLADDDPNDYVRDGYQLHITLFQRRDGEPGREIYAHHEPDWRQTPIKHLYPGRYPGVDYIEAEAADYMADLIDTRTYVNLTRHD